jgi:hypothetical protein
MDELSEKLKERIDTLAFKLEQTPPGTKEYSDMADELVKLYQIRNDELRICVDAEDRMERRQIDENFRQGEQDLKYDQQKTESKFRTVESGLKAAGIILPLWLYSTLFRNGLEFEKEGIIRSSMFRNLLSGIRPKR